MGWFSLSKNIAKRQELQNHKRIPNMALSNSEKFKGTNIKTKKH